MSGKFLLDTNVVIRLLNADADVRRRADSADESFASTIVLGELFYGAYKSRLVRENVMRVQEFA